MIFFCLGPPPEVMFLLIVFFSVSLNSLELKLKGTQALYKLKFVFACDFWAWRAGDPQGLSTYFVRRSHTPRRKRGGRNNWGLVRAM